MVSGCSADVGPGATANNQDARHLAEGTVLQPGRPGEAASTLPPDAELPAGRYNDADVEFAEMMIAHHAQALELGELAQKRAQDRQVAAVAERIADAQGAEILNMSAWLQRRGIEAPTAEDLEHGGHMMPGMLTDAEIERLESARGRRFDELYLQSMIEHHRGAVEMAGRALDVGTDIVIGELAADVAAGQTAEIRRMDDLLAEL